MIMMHSQTSGVKGLSECVSKGAEVSSRLTVAMVVHWWQNVVRDVFIEWRCHSVDRKVMRLLDSCRADGARSSQWNAPYFHNGVCTFPKLMWTLLSTMDPDRLVVLTGSQKYGNRDGKLL